MITPQSPDPVLIRCLVGVRSSLFHKLASRACSLALGFLLHLCSSINKALGLFFLYFWILAIMYFQLGCEWLMIDRYVFSTAVAMINRLHVSIIYGLS